MADTALNMAEGCSIWIRYGLFAESKRHFINTQVNIHTNSVPEFYVYEFVVTVHGSSKCKTLDLYSKVVIIQAIIAPQTIATGRIPRLLSCLQCKASVCPLFVVLAIVAVIVVLVVLMLVLVQLLVLPPLYSRHSR